MTKTYVQKKMFLEKGYEPLSDQILEFLIGYDMSSSMSVRLDGVGRLSNYVLVFMLVSVF